MIILSKIIEYGIYLLAFLLPLQTRFIIRSGEINGGYNEYATISLYAIDILILVLFFCFIVFQIKMKYFSLLDKKISTFFLILIGLDLSFFISVFLAPDKILAFYKYILFLVGVGLIWLLANANYKRTKLVWFLFGGLILQAGLGLWQFFTQSSFANKWFGISLHEPSFLGTSVIETFSQGRWLRAYGGLDHPNILGAFLVIGIILALFAFVGLQKNNLKLQRISLLIICPILAVVLFFTFSRAAWLGLILGLAISFILIIKKEDYEKFRQGAGVILIIFFAFSVMFFLYYDLAKVRFTKNTRLENISYNERIESLAQGVNVIKEHWLLGVGAGNYVISLSELNPGYKSWIYQPVHNTFLLIWSEIGFFGLAFFIILLLYLFDQGLKTRDAFSLAIIICVIFMMNFDHWWWSLHFGFLFLWFLLGLLYARHDVK